jgi:hypothetical protein
MRLFLRNGSPFHYGKIRWEAPLKVHLSQSQSAISPEVMLVI